MRFSLDNLLGHLSDFENRQALRLEHQREGHANPLILIGLGPDHDYVERYRLHAASCERCGGFYDMLNLNK